MALVRRFVPLCAALACLGAAPAHAANDQKQGAQATFDAGSKLYDAHRLEEALVAFRASYQIVPSPNSRLMVARCLRDLGRDVDAYREYLSVAAEATEQGEKYAGAKVAADEEGAEVRQKIALVTVRLKDAPPGTAVKIGQDSLDPALVGTPLPLVPGDIVVTADAPGGASARAEITLQAGAAEDVELVLVAPVAPAVAPPPPPPPPAAPPPEERRSLRPWAFVAGGVGVVGLVGFGVFGAMSASKFSSLESSCPGGRCPPGKQSDIDSGKSSQTIANVGLVLGIVGVGAGVTLYLLEPRPSAEGAGTARVSLHVSGDRVTVQGAF